MHRNLPKFNESSYAHFVTARTYKGHRYFDDEGCCRIVEEQLKFYAGRYGFDLMGYVIMPDHLHLVAWWDVEDKPGLTVSKIMNSIKTMTAKRIKRYLCYDGGLAYSRSLADVGQATRGPFRLWQPGFYDFNVWNETTLLEKLNYVQNNPVTAVLVSSPEDYKWSSCGSYLPEKVERA